MIVHDVEQGTVEWLRLRSGIPTASEFKRILTPEGKLSRQADGYMRELLAEWIVGHPITGPETEWMRRGTELEDQAVAAYEFQTDAITARIGFVTTDDGMIGASPDRVIGETKLLEIKCPKPSNHVGYMLTGAVEAEYRPQLQGQLYVTGRQSVDIVSYCPEMPPVIITVERDEVYIEKLAEALQSFLAVMEQAHGDLHSRYGPFTRPAPPEQRADSLASLGVTDDDLAAMIKHHEQIGTWDKTEART